MSTDTFLGENHVADPARRVYLITAHDTNRVDPLPKAIRADNAGTITFCAEDSGADVVMNVVAGEVLAVRARFIRATGTTVTVIHGFG